MLEYNIIKEIALDNEEDDGVKELYKKIQLLERFFEFYDINMETQMYPKGIFEVGKKVFYIFRETSIICIDLGDEINIREIKLSSVKSYIFKIHDRYSISLQINVEDSEPIIISNIDDCNANYKSEFYKYIIEVLNIAKNCV